MEAPRTSEDSVPVTGSAWELPAVRGSVPSICRGLGGWFPQSETRLGGLSPLVERPRVSAVGTGPVSVTDDYDDDDLTLLQATGPRCRF